MPRPSITPPPTVAPATPAFGEALRYWFKLGCLSFGGPAGQIALMHVELVERRRWISERRFLHALNYCMLLPGPEAQQLATYLGWLLHGRLGGLASGSLFVLPSLLLLLGLSWVYLCWGTLPLLAAMLHGIKPAVVAIVLHAAYRLAQRTLHTPALWLLAGAAFVAIGVLHAPFPAVIGGAGLLGLGLGRYPRIGLLRPAVPAAAAPTAAPRALIDDDTPPPAHARASRGAALRSLGVGAAIALCGIVALRLSCGSAATLPQMAVFFSKAALLTFGGAYAVLPYVYQGAVTQFHWLSAAQMIDGLALGESTPGPLIMVNTYVGFIGGWTQQATGSALGGGVAGALTATFFTFLPSFVFIFAGAPLIEYSRGQPRLGAPLTAIAAAVVGVILNLAVFFAIAVFWPQGRDAAPDGLALGLFAAAAIALFRYRLSVIRLLLASLLAGALLAAR